MYLASVKFKVTQNKAVNGDTGLVLKRLISYLILWRWAWSWFDKNFQEIFFTLRRLHGIFGQKSEG